jgi:hypothetical protein
MQLKRTGELPGLSGSEIVNTSMIPITAVVYHDLVVINSYSNRLLCLTPVQFAMMFSSYDRYGAGLTISNQRCGSSPFSFKGCTR